MVLLWDRCENSPLESVSPIFSVFFFQNLKDLDKYSISYATTEIRFNKDL